MKPAAIALIGLAFMLVWKESFAAATDNEDSPSQEIPPNDPAMDYSADSFYSDELQPEIVVHNVSSSGARGIRNNNPGNIRLSADKWQGLSPNQTDPAFFQFDDMKWGIRALVSILRTYLNRYSINTVSGIISRWAPVKDKNNTAAYIASVCNSTGFAPNAVINVYDGSTAFSLVRAIIKVENGAIAAATIPDDVVWEGISLAS